MSGNSPRQGKDTPGGRSRILELQQAWESFCVPPALEETSCNTRHWEELQVSVVGLSWHQIKQGCSGYVKQEAGKISKTKQK